MNNTTRNSQNRVGRVWSRGLTWLFVLALFATSSVSAQLSGTYTICASGCNYSSFSAAVNDLKTNGVKGAVTFNVSPESFNEQVNIPGISGASATNIITFHGTGTTPSKTYLYYSTSSQGTLILNGASYVKFDNMQIENTYSPSYLFSYVAAAYMNSCNFCTIDNCILKIAGGGSAYYYCCLYDANSKGSNTISNSVARGGMYGMYFTGSTSYGNDIIKNNGVYQFYQYGIYGNNISLNTYDANTVDSGSYYYGMACYSSYESGATWKNNKINMKNPCYYGFYLYNPNSNSQTNTFTMVNNMISCGGYGIYSYNYGGGFSNLNVSLLHNSVSGVYYGLYLQNSSNGYKILNNIFTATSSYAAYYYSMKATDKIDGNDYYGTNIYYNGSGMSFTNFQKAAANNGHAIHDQNIQPYFKSSSDFHLDPTKTAPFGPYAGVSTDIDGDARCLTFPTSGVDEVTGGAKSATITGTKFTGPSRVYFGNPATFLNTANVSDPKMYKWYINNKFITDSFHMTSTAFVGPTDQVKLVAYNCGSKDSFTMNVSVDTPKAKPVADFIANKNVILQGDRVVFTDLSSNYPSSWKWSISPDSTLDQTGKKVSTYTVMGGGLNKPSMDLRFNYSGKYKICLTTSNLRGTSAQECKVDYIEVIPAYNLGSTAKATAPRGYIYDNGGPNNNYSGGYGTTYKMVVDACADSIYLVFNKFDVWCGADVVNVYEGTDNSGNNLYKKCASAYNVMGNGYSGGPSSTYCYSPNSLPGCYPKPTDTLKAKSNMYIEMKIYGYTPGGAGFEAYYWTKPRAEKKPVAKFSSPDSVCTNSIASFINQTVGSNVSYSWDLDGDISFIESNSKNTSYPYLSAGKVTVTLIASNCGGSDTFRKTITVYDPPKPNAAYTVDNTTPTTSDVVLFASTTKECVDAYTWSFTPQSGTGTASFVNGTSKSSSNPQVVFSSKGCWDMTLVVSNKTGQSTVSKTCVVNVRDPYCTPTVSNLLPDLGISKVTMGDINYSSPSADAAYHNYAPFAQSRADIGVTYTLTVERPTNKNKISHAVWIDWNGDGDFADAKEYVDSEFNSTSLTWTTKVTVPTIAKVGATIMRIASNQGSWSSTPCGPNNFGEFEDYRLYVGPDATPPVITLVGKDTVKVEQGYTYNDSGATANDNLDGNITSKITVKITNGSTVVNPPFNTLVAGTYVFHYNVSDAAGNPAKEVRRVVVITPDKTAPDLIVETPDTIIVDLGNSFTPPAVISANDLVDGPLDQYVTVNNPVHTDASGNVDVVDTYSVTYTVTDKNNNTAKVIRTVIVRDVTAPVLTLIGSNPAYVQVLTSYKDAGVSITDNYYSSGELMKLVSVSSNVDTNKVGTYTVVYNLTDPSGNSALAVTRTVIVRDTIAPVVTMNGKATMKMRVYDEFTDPGATATDNYDKTVPVTISGTFYPTLVNGAATKVGKFTIVYTATDASGNSTSVTREVFVIDDMAPVVTLKGSTAAEVCRWKKYTDAGASVTDNYDKNPTLVMEGTVDVSKDGLYTIRWKATDSSGNVGYSEPRYILVKTPESCGTTGIENGNGIDKYISIYPNPSNGLFTIKSNLPTEEKNVRITVTNLLGQPVASVNNSTLGNNTMFQVDLSSQASGVYLVNIITGTQSVTKQIVLTK